MKKGIGLELLCILFLIILLTLIHPKVYEKNDLNRDGRVDITDIQIMAEQWLLETQ